MAKRKVIFRAAEMTPAAAEAHLRGVVLGEGCPAWEREVDRLVDRLVVLDGVEVGAGVRAFVRQRLQALVRQRLQDLADAHAAEGE